MNANDLQKRATVLVVDDEARNVELLETLLHAEGYATLVAANGSEAIALAETAQPDLILLDVMMPDMDGFETVARLKADPRTRPVAVIMIAALDDRNSRLRALDARLTGEAIPLAARLMQICDGYDALRSKRPYKQPIDRARCVGIITRGNGRVEPEHFDPAVLACFSAHAKNSALSTSGLPMPDGKKG